MALPILLNIFALLLNPLAWLTSQCYFIFNPSNPNNALHILSSPHLISVKYVISEVQ